MKSPFIFLATALLAAPAAVSAQDNSENQLQGLHFGIDATRDSNEVSQPTSTTEASRKGFGGRVHAGYDLVLGNFLLVGAEVGVGLGGRTVDQLSLTAPGRYKADPGLSYDATARAGITPTNGLVVYGRGGYRWLRVEESVVDQAAGNFSNTITQKGFTYGGGIELALSENLAVRAEYNRTNFDQDFKQSKISVGALVRF
ncbi:MAG: porin family protein [Parasphingorhabdus sp.]